MPKEKIGNIISKVHLNKKNVVIFFVNREKLEISFDAYTSNYIYVGKELSDKDIEKLVRVSGLKKLMEYAMKLLSKGHYTEWRMREKLYAKGGDKESVDFIIDRLKQNDLIDDSAFAYDYVCYANERCYGKNRIKEELAKKGVFAEEIEKIRFPESLEKKKALSLIPSLEKRYAKYSYESKKQHIYYALLAKGFDSDVALFALNSVSHKNDKDEINKLKADYKKAKEKYKKKYDGYQLKEKVIQRLRSKGYRYSDIRRIVEEDDYDF